MIQKSIQLAVESNKSHILFPRSDLRLTDSSDLPINVNYENKVAGPFPKASSKPR